MSDSPTGTMSATWGVAARAFAGAPESGDQYWARSLPGLWEVAVVDGLGHSANAAEAARATLSALEASTPGAPLEGMFRRAHEAAQGTRGAVMTVARCDLGSGALTWLGVGNVQAALYGEDAVPKANLLMRGGVVGHRMPTLHATTVPVAPGDVLVLATDGLRSEWSHAFTPRGTPQEMADRVLAEYARPTDDALVLVARFAEEEP
jgi:negative regulator of sigma-B (phosphoserine phosphatase)